MKNILKYIIWGGLFLTPFLAFLVPSGMFFPFITGKGFAFRILVEIIFGLYVILAFADREYRPRFSWITKSFLLFTAIIFVADLLGENSYKSIWSNFERMEGFVLLIHLVMFYFVISSVFKTRELWNKFFNTSIFGSFLMSVYGLFQLAGLATISQGGVRVDGTFGNSTYFAIYLVFHIFLSVYMLASGVKKSWHKWAYVSLIVLEIVLLYFTATRGAILGLIGGVVLTGVLLLWGERDNQKIRKFSYWVIGGILALIFGFVLLHDTAFVKNSPVMSRFSNLSFAEFKTQGRYYVWPMALEGVKERPLLGWGQENFNFVFNKYYNPGLFGQEEWFDRTHNLFLDWLIAGGIIGFLAYVSIYIAFFYYVWRRENAMSTIEKSVLTGMISAYIFHNIFVFDNLISYIIFFSILAYVHSVGFTERKETSRFHTATFSADTLNYMVLPIAVVLTAGIIYFVNVPAIKTNFTLIQSLQPQKEGVNKNLALFNQVFEYNSFGSTEALEQLVQTTIQMYKTTAPDKVKQDFYDLSKLKIEEKIAKTPNDARYLVFAGGFFNKFSKYDEAIKYLERALVESPKKQSIYFELGTSYLAIKNKEKMLELFKTAYELKPSAPESQMIYTIGAIYAGNKKVLNELLLVVPESSIISDARILTAYSGVGDYDSAIAILKKRLEKDPNNLQTNFTLAELYAQKGQKQMAINLLREMIAGEPRFKDQGEAIIRQIQGQ